MSTVVAEESTDGLETHDEKEIEHGQRVLSSSVMVVAIRCTLQYVALPFVLPLIGVSSRLSIWLTGALEVFALGFMLYNVRRLWNTSWRWRYIGLSALTSAVLLFFLYEDVVALIK